MKHLFQSCPYIDFICDLDAHCNYPSTEKEVYVPVRSTSLVVDGTQYIPRRHFIPDFIIITFPVLRYSHPCYSKGKSLFPCPLRIFRNTPL